MIILGIEFLAIIVICYLFLVCATRDRISGGKKKPIPIWAMAMVVMIPIVMILFISWYARIELAP